MQAPTILIAYATRYGSTKEVANSIAETLRKQMAKYPWLQPVALELFGGKLDPMALRFPENLLTKIPGSPLHNLSATDARDMNAIRAWAESLVTKLQPAILAGEVQQA